MRNLLNETKIVRALARNAGASGNTIKGTIVDTQGYDSALFLITFQDVVNAAKITPKVAQADTDDTADMVVSTAALTLRLVAGADTDDKMMAIEVVNPQKRYLEIQVVIADQNAPIDAIHCLLGNAAHTPVAQHADVVDSDTFVSPGAA